MKEKRFFCDWLEDKREKHWLKIGLALIVIAAVITCMLKLSFSDFSIFSNPEEVYKRATEAGAKGILLILDFLAFTGIFTIYQFLLQEIASTISRIHKLYKREKEEN